MPCFAAVCVAAARRILRGADATKRHAAARHAAAVISPLHILPLPRCCRAIVIWLRASAATRCHADAACRRRGTISPDGMLRRAFDRHAMLPCCHAADYVTDATSQ